MDSKAREAQRACVSREADVDSLLSGGASANTSSNVAQSDDAHQAPLVSTRINCNEGPHSIQNTRCTWNRCKSL